MVRRFIRDDRALSTAFCVATDTKPVRARTDAGKIPLDLRKTYPRLSTISVDIRPLPIKTDAVSIGYVRAYFLSTTDFRIKRSYFLRISIYPDELPIPFTPAKGIMIVNRKDKI